MVGHKRKKSSGYFYGKQKEKQREEDEQMSGSLSNFFINTKSKPTTGLLTGLSLISIESDIAKKLDFTELLKAFASEKCRKVNFFH